MKNIKAILVILFLVFSGISGHAQHSRASEKPCASAFDYITHMRERLLVADSNFEESIRNEGLFLPAAEDHKAFVLDSFLRWRKQKADGSAVYHDLVDINPEDLVPLPSNADFRQVLTEKNPYVVTPEIEQELAVLRSFGYENGYSGLATVVSHGGLWTRGGGDLIKALAVLNGVELFSEQEKSEIVDYSKILVQAKNGVRNEEIEHASHQVKKIFYHALQSPKAMPSKLFTLLQMAVLSELSGSYIISDSWTGLHTHKAIANYLHGRYAHLDELVLCDDPLANAMLVNALRKYLGASAVLKQTHLFGLQVELKLIAESADKTPHWVDGSPSSGEGAGMFPIYYQASGRAKFLKDRGIKTLMFRNSEVFGPVHEELAAFRKSGRPMGYVVVSALPNESGGNPNKRIVPGLDAPLFPMLEQSNLPPGTKPSNGYFNSNTGFFDLDALMSWEIDSVAFEPTGPYFRTKVNAMDPSLKLPSVLIQGERPRNYASMKEIEHMLLMGGQIVNLHTKELIELQKSR